MPHHSRRDFLATTTGAVFAGALLPRLSAADSPRSHFKVGLATLSFLRTFRAGEIGIYDFFKLAREDLGIGILDFKQNVLGVPSLAVVDRLNLEREKYDCRIDYLLAGDEGRLASRDADERARSLEYHDKWFPIARDLGCKAIRADWHGPDTGAGTITDKERVRAVIERSVPVFKTLCERAARYGLGIRLENHGGISGYPEVLLELLEKVNAPNLATFVDFGNFPKDVDKYAAVDQMMPTVDMVTAKCYDFDEKGEEKYTDFERMFKIIFDKHHFKGNIHIEWEGKRMTDMEGVEACLALLRRLRGDDVK